MYPKIFSPKDETMTKLSFLKEIVGSDLGNPSKMPGYAWGISATLCNIGSKLRPISGTVCHKCYALKGNYLYESVVKSHANRLAGYNADPIAWRSAMAELIRKRIPESAEEDDKYFRIFDSGDLQSEAMLRDWIWIAEQLPDIQFWLPTKEYALIDGFMGTLPDNFVVRVSSPKIDMVPLKAYKFTSTVHDKSESHGFVCRAYERDGKCDDCRACWSRLVSNVSYPKH
jgi:hypothetical protein